MGRANNSVGLSNMPEAHMCTIALGWTYKVLRLLFVANDDAHAHQGAAARAVGAPLSLSASILGLGPRFRLLLAITNEGDGIATQLQMLVSPDNAEAYHVHAPHKMLPPLVPLLSYVVQVWCTRMARCVHADMCGRRYHRFHHHYLPTASCTSVYGIFLQVDVTSMHSNIPGGRLRVVLLAPGQGPALLRATVHMPDCDDQ